MCISFAAAKRDQLDMFDAPLRDDGEWPADVFQDYLAPFIVAAPSGGRRAMLGSYAMVPRRKMRPGANFDTMNARAETIGQLKSYAKPWAAAQLCLIPLQHFYEPNWETGAHVRWWIGAKGHEPCAVAGLWRSWDEADGTKSHSFTQITVNADAHPLMSRFHRPDKEKRSLVILEPSEYDDWLMCKDPERARAYLNLYPAELMDAGPAPQPPRKSKDPERLAA